MEKKTRDILGYGISAALAVVLLWFSFRGVAWGDFWQGARSCRWGFILTAMGSGLLAFLLRALRWRELLLPIDPSTQRRTCLNAINISYLVNMVLPRVGELVRCGYVSKHSDADGEGGRKASFDKVLGTVVVDRVWDTVTLLILVLALAVPMGSKIASIFGGQTLHLDDRLPWLLGGAVLLVLVLLAVVWRLREKSAICGKVWHFVEGIFRGMASCLRMKGWWKFLLYTLLVWTCYWASSAGVLWAVQGRLPGFEALTLTDALFLMIVGSVSTAVPVPGGFGAYHYLISTTLTSLYGIPAEQALIWATLSHESQALVQILAGGASYLHETFRK